MGPGIKSDRQEDTATLVLVQEDWMVGGILLFILFGYLKLLSCPCL
jgi:hypothetical protein